jgi:segregation and condensation protein A
LDADAPEPFRVTLPSFEGPLDLLLHLIREHKLDLLDIPVAFITERYLEYLALMRELNIDLAAEFLVMAATLAHLKSKMLLPREVTSGQDGPDEEAGQDPRTALVIRLLEYQKYRDAGDRLAGRALLGRDVFARPPSLSGSEEEAELEAGLPLREASAFDLVAAFARSLDTPKRQAPEEIVTDRLSLSDAIGGIVDRLALEAVLSFRQLVEPLFAVGEPEPPLRRERVVITLLALLEMARLRLIHLRQDAEGEIMLERRMPQTDPSPRSSMEGAAG